MRKKEKISYEIDPHNRLIVKKTGKVSRVAGYRKILDGRFKIGKDNSLIYHIKKSSQIDVPQQIKLSGSYSLKNDKNLVFTLNKWNNQVQGNKFIIKGRLLDAKDDELSFTVGTRDSDGNRKIYILKLSGAWQANKHNRLSFNVKREKGAIDNLTLEGSWKINNNNEIIYTHTESHLKRKVNILNTLTFKGHWDISKKNKISYILNKDINSGFDFEVGFVRALKSGIEYKISIGGVPKEKTVTLSGRWKLNKKLGLLFEVPYEKSRIKAITFGADCKLTKKDTLEFRLKSALNEDLGASLKLSRKILKDQGKAFIEALKQGKEVSITAGIGFRW